MLYIFTNNIHIPESSSDYNMLM